MSLEDIRSLPVSDLAEQNCALFLWVTDPMLQEAFKLIEAWGFRYKTVAFNWAQLNARAPALVFSEQDFFTGMGYWTRANSELCLLATRGKPKRLSKAVRRLVVDRRREHSRKPDSVAARIVDLMGDVPRIELFARQSREGWDSWGDDAEKFDNRRIVPPLRARSSTG